jgi:hypothetical protein
VAGRDPLDACARAWQQRLRNFTVGLWAVILEQPDEELCDLALSGSAGGPKCRDRSSSSQPRWLERSSPYASCDLGRDLIFVEVLGQVFYPIRGVQHAIDEADGQGGALFRSPPTRPHRQSLPFNSVSRPCTICDDRQAFVKRRIELQPVIE